MSCIKIKISLRFIEIRTNYMFRPPRGPGRTTATYGPRGISDHSPILTNPRRVGEEVCWGHLCTGCPGRLDRRGGSPRCPGHPVTHYVGPASES